MAGRRAPKLDAYRRKRRFQQTPEPATTSRKRPTRDTRQKSRKFVVHLHHARNRHFDLRLQVGNVLRSWAVPKGPSRDPSIKRLAVEVEDHPLDYADFEGTIPKGHYGAGSVAIWDAGTWHTDRPIDAQFEDGHVHFELDGSRLHGGWSLIRTRMRGKQPQWLLVKADDASTVENDVADDVPLSQWQRDNATPRPAQRGETPQKSARHGKLPGAEAFELELARLHARAPQGEDWLHEVKFDGYRMLAWRNPDKLRLLSRNRREWTGKLPGIAQAIQALPCRACVLDGELVVFDANSRSRFDLLQREFNRSQSQQVRFVVFDLLWLDADDLRPRPLHERKAALEKLLAQAGDTLAFSDFIVGNGARAYAEACKAGLEGIISKAMDAPYRGGRGDAWRKLKCIDSDEFVIVGYTPGKGSRGALGALLLARPDGRWWRYVGRVGTGMDDAELTRLYATLAPTHIAPKLADPPTPKQLRGAQPVWVRPRHVVEIAFRGLTGDGLLRQASYKGLRPDKSPRDLHDSDRNEGGHAMPNESTAPSGSSVVLTHPERVLIGKPRTTKGDLAEFYASIADPLLPGLVGRPLALLRCPDGAGEPCFFQKHPMDGMPDAIRVGDARAVHSTKNAYVYVDGIDGVLGLVQMGVIEFHPWGSTVDDIDHPDRLVFDIDPDAGVKWPRVRAAATTLRERLHAVGLESFLRTTGGKGLHVVVPLDPRPEWENAKAFALALARTLEQDAPDEYVSVASKSRRSGRIFIDYLRNARGATAVASYSVRARPGAAVATPLRWDELPRLRSSTQYTLRNIRRRLSALKDDPWNGIDTLRQALPEM